jgi:hypothetical protein
MLEIASIRVSEGVVRSRDPRFGRCVIRGNPRSVVVHYRSAEIRVPCCIRDPRTSAFRDASKIRGDPRFVLHLEIREIRVP